MLKLSPAFSLPLAALTLFGACDAGPSDAVLAQQAAHGAWTYVLGDEASAPADPVLRTMLDELRAAIDDGRTHVGPMRLGRILGLEVAIYDVYGTSETTSDVSMLVDDIAAELAQANPLADRFFAIDRGAIDVAGGRFLVRGIDPAPAQLTQPLGAAVGVSAAAVFVNSGEATSVTNLSSQYAACGTLAGGEACSTTALAAGETATGMVWKKNGYCKCL